MTSPRKMVKSGLQSFNIRPTHVAGASPRSVSDLAFQTFLLCFERGLFRDFDIRLGGLSFRFLPHQMLGVFASLGPKSVWRGVKTSSRFWGSSGHHSLTVIRFFVMLFVRNSGRHSACYAGSLDARGRRSTGRFHGRVCSDAFSVPVACCPRRPRFRRLRPLLAPLPIMDCCQKTVFFESCAATGGTADSVPGIPSYAGRCEA